MFTLFTYMALIVGVNYAFAVTPLIELPNGEMWAPLSLIVGFIFVVRDYAQRRVGHQVLWAMLVGCVISWYMATPQLALASAAAFASSSPIPAATGTRSTGLPDNVAIKRSREFTYCAFPVS